MFNRKLKSSVKLTYLRKVFWGPNHKGTGSAAVHPLSRPASSYSGHRGLLEPVPTSLMCALGRSQVHREDTHQPTMHAYARLSSQFKLSSYSNKCFFLDFGKRLKYPEKRGNKGRIYRLCRTDQSSDSNLEPFGC